MAEADERDKPPRKRKGCCLGRVIAVFAVILLLGVGILAGALYAGWPQRAAIRMAADGIGLEAEVGAVRLTPYRLELASLVLHRKDDRRETPLLLIENLYAGFSPFDRSQPPVTAVTIDTLGLWLDADDFPEPGEPRLREPRRPREPRDPEAAAEFAEILAFLPRSIQIGRLEGGWEQQDLAVAGGPITVEMSNPGGGSLRFAIQGEPTLVAEHAGERFESQDTRMDILVDWSAERIAVETRAFLSPWAELDAEARFAQTATGWDGLVEIASARIEELPPPLLALIPIDAAFRHAAIAPSRVEFALGDEGFLLGPSAFDFRASALRLGPEDAPWFWGDPAIEMTGEGMHFEGRISHDDARSIGFDGLLGTEPAFNVALSGWTYPDLEALTPVDLLDAVGLFSSLHQLDAHANIAFRDGRVSFNGIMTPAFGLDPAWHDQLRLDAAFSVGTEDGSVEGIASLDLAGNAMTLNAATLPGGAIAIDAMMHDFDLPRLAQLLALAPPEVRDLESLFSGNAHILFDDAHIAMKADLEASPPPFLPFDTLRNSRVAFRADLTAPPGFSGLSGSAGFELDPHVSVDAAAVRANLETAGWSTNLSGAVDLGALAAYLDLGPLAGDLSFSAPVRGAREAIETDFSVTIDGPAYDGMGLGYGDLLTFTGTARHPFEGDGAIRDLLITAGEGTRLTAPEAIFTPSPFSFHAPEAAFTSDGLALIGAGYLDGMSGVIEATGDLAYGPDGYRFALDYSTEYSLLTLRNALAVIGGGTGEGHLVWTHEGLEGDGLLAADDLAVFGVTLERVRVPLSFDGPDMLVREFEAGLFNGRVLTNGRVGVLEEGMPVEFVARLRSVDLAPFSETFLTPDTRVTGIANGTVRIQTKDMQVTGFDISLRSARDFTINRDFLAQLVMQEQVGETAGRAVSGVLAEVLGEARQRPFDAADIDLALEDDLIRGKAVLRSQTLNLTVNLTMDPRHVAELMRLNQRQELDRLRGR